MTIVSVISRRASAAPTHWRGPTLKSGGLFRPISREGGLVVNNLLLTVAAAAAVGCGQEANDIKQPTATTPQFAGIEPQYAAGAKLFVD